MDSDSEWDPHSPSSEEEEIEMALVVRSDLESQFEALGQRYSQLSDRYRLARDQNRAYAERVLQLNSEIENLRGNLRDLNLLDGFLRSGAIKVLNLDNDPTLKVLLTSFLARALQTALDSGAVSFPTPRPRER